MRYTKRALLVFGLGLVLGFALIVGEVPGFGWIASGIMALGLVGLPIAVVADGRVAFVQRILARFARPKRAKPRRRATTASSRPARGRAPVRATRRRRH
jgi:molybdopterin biosynthesis enzyme